MLFTRECDYAIRIIRVLYQQEKANVQTISKKENMSIQITYKIAKKLENANIIQSFRGVYGGYAMKKPLDKLTLLDVFMAIDKDIYLTECTNQEYQCSQNTCKSPCAVHKEFSRLQNIIYNEMKAKTLLEILSEN